MSYIIRTAISVASAQALLDLYSTSELVGYSIAKDGTHCLIFKH